MTEKSLLTFFILYGVLICVSIVISMLRGGGLICLTHDGKPIPFWANLLLLPLLLIASLCGCTTKMSEDE